MNTAPAHLKPTLIDVEVNWFHGYGNSPELVVYVDNAWNYYPFENLPHEEVNKDLWVAHDDPWAHFVSVRNRSAGPFSGAATGDLNTGPDSPPLRVFDGWSSRASYVNIFLAEEDHLIDVVLRGGKYGNLGRAGIAMRVSAAREAIEAHNVDFFITRDPTDVEPFYCPSLSKDEIRKP